MSCNLIYSNIEDYNDDIDAALTAYDKLKTNYPEQDFSIAVGGTGNSQPKVYIHKEGILDMSLVGAATHYKHTKWDNLLVSMEKHGVHGIFLEYYYDGFDDLKNDSLEYLHTGAYYNENLETLSNLCGLKTLDIFYYDDNDSDRSNLSFISQMDNLETLTIYGDLSRLEFPNTPCDNITKVEIYNNSQYNTDDLSVLLHDIFPNANIVIGEG